MHMMLAPACSPCAHASSAIAAANRSIHCVCSPKFDPPCRLLPPRVAIAPSRIAAYRNRAKKASKIEPIKCSAEIGSGRSDGRKGRSDGRKGEQPNSSSSSSDAWWCGAGNDSDANMAMPKSDLESCQWLRPSADKGSGLATGNGSVAIFRPNHHSASSVLANAVPSSLALDADFEETWTSRAEARIERAIFDFRFLSLLAVAGSLAGSFLCFVKGCVYIAESYGVFYMMCLNGVHSGNMVLRLVEAVDVFLTGTVMLIFGMGVYGLFISNVPTNLPPNQDRAIQNSSFFGMFLLKERPKWMRIGSLDELKTKLGHVVVMILLVKMFERSKAIIITTGADLLSYSISIFLSSAALLVLHKLHH